MVSYTPKVNNNVILLLSTHDAPTIDEVTGEQRKPEMITFYNSTMGTQLIKCQFILCIKENSSMAFSDLLWFIEYCRHKCSGHPRIKPQLWERIILRKVLKEIGRSLVTPFMQIRVQYLTLPREFRLSIKKFLPEEELVARRNRPPTRGRCNFCPRVQGRKAPLICEGYVKENPKYVFKEHIKVVGDDCLNFLWWTDGCHS